MASSANFMVSPTTLVNDNLMLCDGGNAFSFEFTQDRSYGLPTCSREETDLGMRELQRDKGLTI